MNAASVTPLFYTKPEIAVKFGLINQSVFQGSVEDLYTKKGIVPPGPARRAKKPAGGFGLGPPVPPASAKSYI